MMETKNNNALPDMDFVVAIKLLLLLMTANGAPILARKALGNRFDAPLDSHRTLADGRPLFGPSKTWRGVLAALLATPVVAALLSLTALTGFLVAVLAMVGDLFSSFVKRRLGIAPSGMALGLDQIPESLLPLLIVGVTMNLDWLAILILTLSFLAFELLLSRLLYRLNIRRRPY